MFTRFPREAYSLASLTWQHSFVGEHSRPEAQTTFQTIAALAIGGGYYFRSSGVWSFDIANNKDIVPLGVRFGKVFKIRNAMVNALIEPQATVYHERNWSAIVPTVLWTLFAVSKEALTLTLGQYCHLRHGLGP